MALTEPTVEAISPVTVWSRSLKEGPKSKCRTMFFT